MRHNFTSALQETRDEMNANFARNPQARVLSYALTILAEDDEFYGTGVSLLASLVTNEADEDRRAHVCEFCGRLASEWVLDGCGCSDAVQAREGAQDE